MIEPPPSIISEAVATANLGTCAKSKRGVVIFGARPPWVIISRASNSPPPPFECTGSDRCKSVCRKVAVHAEERALLGAQLGHGDDRRYDLVHVKTMHGELVPGGPPSCLQCSRLVVEVGVHVWLYEGTKVQDRKCVNCDYAHTFTSSDWDLDDCPRCDSELEPLTTIRYEPPAAWRRYTPIEFHQITLENNGIRL